MSNVETFSSVWDAVADTPRKPPTFKHGPS